MLDVKLEAPKLVTVDVTVAEIYEALKKNGFEHVRETWWDGNKGGCVLMQTAWNLDVVPSHDQWDDIGLSGYGIETPHWDDAEANNRFGEIWQKVEQAWEKWSLENQLNRWAVPKSSKWYDEKMDEPRVGSAIIFWNDKRIGGFGSDYALRTYAEVADMAYDLLKPHLEKTVKLLQYEYPDKPARIESKG